MAVIKEIWVYLLAYNLIRFMMAQSALLTDQLPRQLRFKHTVQICIAWHTHAREIARERIRKYGHPKKLK